MGHVLRRLLLACAAIPACCGPAVADETGDVSAIPAANPLLKFNLHLYGFSRHTDQQGVQRAHVDNEVNLGLGLAYELHNDARGVLTIEGGFYQDSGRNWAKLIGPAYKFKLGDHLRLGAGLPVIQSRTYNQGRVFIAPIPMASYDLGIVTLNVAYAPRFQQNQFAVFGFYFSIPLAN